MLGLLGLLVFLVGPQGFLDTNKFVLGRVGWSNALGTRMFMFCWNIGLIGSIDCLRDCVVLKKSQSFKYLMF